jgi:hypothetical protein
MRGIIRSILFGGTVLLAIAFLSANAECAIFDGTFNDGDWTHTVLRDDAGRGTFSANQVLFLGGNPGDWQTGSHHWGSGNSLFAHINSAAGAYDPSIIASIATINYSLDFRVTMCTYVGSDDMYAALLLKQSNQYFVSSAFFFTEGDPWRTVSDSVPDLRFYLATATGFDTNIHPDFSSNGQPIEVGYATYTSTGYYDNELRYGIDNFSVDIVPTPIPSAVWLLATGLMGLVVIRRKHQS